MFDLIKTNLELFINTTNDTTATTGNDLSYEMKTYYSNYLIDLAEPELVHDQFGQKHPIPKNGGKTIEFRKYDSLPKAMTPLTEGVTPDGQKLNVSVITSTVAQYGGFIELSDVLLLTAIDNNLVQATQLLASQAGRTLDTVTREVLNGGTNVLYANNGTARGSLAGGETSGNNYISVKDIRKAVRMLKKMNTPKIDGWYVGIIHPDIEFDIMDDEDWKKPHEYVDTQNIYSNEIGAVAGVRFVESTEAKIFSTPDLTGEARNLTVRSNVTSSTTVPVKEKITSDDATALVGRRIVLGSTEYTIASASAAAAGSASITTGSSVASASTNDVIYPAGAGAKGRNIYSTLVMGANAYGVTEVTGGGLQHIVKQLGSSGTADPLNQRATAGWKAIKTAERLVEQYLVRIESTSTFNDIFGN